MVEVPVAFAVSDWTAYATIGSTVIAVLAFVISIWTGWIQRQHNKLSVMPLPEIQLKDMNGYICVKLINNGTGPLIIKKLEVLHGKNVVGRALIDLMPPGGSEWSFFVYIVDDRSIAPNGEIILLELEYDPNDSVEQDFATLTRQALCTLCIDLSYKGIYGDTFPVYKKDLTWFCRLLKTFT
ncbi:hypothetical protein JYG35_18590 [Pseudomonas rhodesiae]|uniref:hypothetical protein n=1 Tax=Pseudomonas rhodesiae TaxID=76760 RepID=UPI001BD08A94|nr:hypothetical protein [Pseudomonas rhodesiae]QVN05640.1 hypothetical protein JYG35_18590 [Pseudomonas rhodesiae]